MTQTVTRRQSEPEIDPVLLNEARQHLGEVSPNEAINAALLEFVEHWRERRRRALENLQRMAEEDGLDFDAIEEADR